MQKWSIAALLIAVAGAAGWFAWRSLPIDRPAPTAELPATPRESFHITKPIYVVVERRATEEDASEPIEWLAREVRHLLGYGKMRLVHATPPPDNAFTLRLELVEPEPEQEQEGGEQEEEEEKQSSRIHVALLAPDANVEREIEMSVDFSDRLATVRALAGELPPFLGAVRTSGDWSAAIGTENRAAYETFLQGATELLGPTGRGFTHPPAVAGQRTRTLERLEALTRRQPEFARAWGLLALAYLGLTGDDHAALTKMSEAAAKRAMSLMPDLAEAHAAWGLIALRRGEWAMAQEQLDMALTIDGNAVAALEGLACLWADAGRSAAALPVAERAVAMQPQNGGARECLTYAQLAVSPETRRAAAANPQLEDPAVARVTALTAILSGDTATAQRALHRSAARGSETAWIDPMVRAAGSRRYTAAALQAITRAASDGDIDASTEILCGAALRQPDFVFNRMLRLQKQNQAVPLRILWLEDTEFLRRHPRFQEIINAAGLAAFWQDHGLPDICATDPTTYGCHVSVGRSRLSADVRR